MTMKATNALPPPLLLPASAYSPDINYWEADDRDSDDTGSIDSMSTIATTCEAADDMIEFVVAFDHPCVVVYLLEDQRQPRDFYCNTLQPHFGRGSVDFVKEDMIDTKVALLLMAQLERYHHVLLPKVVQDASIIAPASKDDSSWRGHHCSFESLPTFRVPDDENEHNKIVGGAPLPAYLVRPKKGYQAPAPAPKRFRVTPESSPLRVSPTFIPPVYISVPNPLANLDG